MATIKTQTPRLPFTSIAVFLGLSALLAGSGTVPGHDMHGGPEFNTRGNVVIADQFNINARA